MKVFLEFEQCDPGNFTAEMREHTRRELNGVFVVKDINVVDEYEIAAQIYDLTIRDCLHECFAITAYLPALGQHNKKGCVR